MTINGKAILEKLQAAKKQERGRFTLYLSKDVYAEFVGRCGDIPTSNVLEELMRQFIATTSAQPGKTR